MLLYHLRQSNNNCSKCESSGAFSNTYHCFFCLFTYQKTIKVALTNNSVLLQARFLVSIEPKTIKTFKKKHEEL